MRTRTLAIGLLVGLASGALTACQDESPTVQSPASPTSQAQAGQSTATASPTAVATQTTDPPTASTPSLAGSRWSGSNSLGSSMTLYLKADGQFDYTTDGQSRDTTPGNDPWTQTGSTLVLKTNGGYATYTGLVSGDRYTGSARNVTGKTWTFSFTQTN